MHNIYLIGPTKSRFEGRKLPTHRQVLQLFVHKHSEDKLTIRHSATETIKELRKIWQTSEIPVRQALNSTNHLVALHKRWINLKKNRLRMQSKAQLDKEKTFNDLLDKLFDVARHNVNEELTADQKLFLKSQQSEFRRGFIPKSSVSTLEPSTEIKEETFDVNTMEKSNTGK